jgi:MYXO-CTERM domain-containing protein
VIARRSAPLGCALFALACGGAPEDRPEPLGQVSEAAVKAPLASAYCNVVVEGKGTKSMEDDYLPRVITCENGGANLQALKAQAIAARSVAYYNMATKGSICDSQGCQVYTCGAAPSAKAYQAVKETAGMYLSYASTLTYGFYVAGDSKVAPPGCIDGYSTTTKWITYNEGKTGADVKQTTLGYVSYPIFGQNRGCMGQWGARCLENNRGYDWMKILQFYYGADIQVLTATGPCVGTTPPPPVNQPPKGYLDEASCTAIGGWAQDPDAATQPIDVHLYCGGPAGSGATSKSVRADRSRADLCAAIGSCEHAFDLAPPLSLMDGQPHAIHAYGIDTAGGANAELTGSGKTLTCDPPAASGVRRHVTNPESLAAWKFDLFWQKLALSDEAIGALPIGEALPGAPELIQADDGSAEVWVADGTWRRHVPNPEVLAAWSFSFGDILQKPANEVYALKVGPQLRSSPVLVQSSDGKVELLDDPYPTDPPPAAPGTGGSNAGGSSAGTASSGAAGTGTGEGGAGAGSGQRTSVVPGEEEGSCACRAAPSGGGNAWAGTLLVASALLARRRRKQRS